jgi:hypothetical protein
MTDIIDDGESLTPTTEYRLTFDAADSQQAARWEATGKGFDDPECDWNSMFRWNTRERFSTDLDPAGIFEQYHGLKKWADDRTQPIRNVHMWSRAFNNGGWVEMVEVL